MINLWTIHLLNILHSKWIVSNTNGYPELILNHSRYNLDLLYLNLTDLELNAKQLSPGEYEIMKFKLVTGIKMLQEVMDE